VRTRDADALLDYLLPLLGRGSSNAVPASELAADLGVGERMVGALAAELIERGVLVGSSCEAGRHGYFLITSLEDLDVGTRHYRSRAVASLRRARLLRDAAVREFGNQGVLPLFPFLTGQEEASV
jgi:hypothetical protein